jgi:hypothetical protein
VRSRLGRLRPSVEGVLQRFGLEGVVASGRRVPAVESASAPRRGRAGTSRQSSVGCRFGASAGRQCAGVRPIVNQRGLPPWLIGSRKQSVRIDSSIAWGHGVGTRAGMECFEEDLFGGLSDRRPTRVAELRLGGTGASSPSNGLRPARVGSSVTADSRIAIRRDPAQMIRRLGESNVQRTGTCRGAVC